MRRSTLGAAVAGGVLALAPSALAVSRDTLAARATSALSAHAAAVRDGAGQAFVTRDVIVDRDGTTHVRLARSYKGLAVLGGDLVVHQGAKGAWKGASLTLADAPSLGVVPAIAAPVEGARLVVEARKGAPRLAWLVTKTGTKADGTPSRVETTIDALTGATLVSEERIETVTGSGTGRTNGTVPLETTLASGSYQLKDPTRGNTYTVDAQNKADTCVVIWCSRAKTVN